MICLPENLSGESGLDLLWRERKLMGEAQRHLPPGRKALAEVGYLMAAYEQSVADTIDVTHTVVEDPERLLIEGEHP